MSESTDAPPQVRYGRAVGRFVSLLADSPDEGNVPDQLALAGKVTLTPRTKAIRFPTTVPPRLATVKPIVCRLSDQGDLLPPTGTVPGVWLTSSFQPDGFPTYFQWEASFQFEGLTSTQQPANVIFEVPDGGDIDISMAISIMPESGTVVIVSHEDRVAVQQMRAEIEDLLGAVGTPDMEPTPGTLARRDETGAVAVAAPTAPEHAARRAEVEVMAKWPTGATQSTATIAATFPDVTLAQVQALDPAATLSDTADWYVLADFLTQCAAANTRSIRIPEGDYRLSRGLSLGALQYGAFIDARGVILRPIQEMPQVVLLKHAGNYWKGRRANILGLEIRGDFHPDAGIRIEGVQEWSLTSVRIHQCYVGINMADTWYGAIEGETVIQDCLTGVHFDALNTAEINTIGLNNVKVNFTVSKALFTREVTPESVGVKISVMMGGINFDGWILEGMDVGIKYVPRKAGTGQQSGRFAVTSCYFENIGVRFFDFTGMTTAGFTINKNDITVTGNRFLPKVGMLESIFSTGAHTIVGNQPLSIRIVQAAVSSRMHAVIDEHVTLLDEFATASQQTLIYRIQSTPTDKNWRRYGAWGDKNAFPNNDGMVGTMGAANYLIGPSATNLRGTNASPSKWYEVRTIQPRPVVFYPINGEPNGPVMCAPDGTWWMLQIGVGGALSMRQVTNLHRIDESPAHRTAKELWYLTDLALGTKYFCTDLGGTELTLTDIGGGVRRWTDSSGRTRIAAMPELLTGAASIPNGANVYDVNTSQVSWTATGVFRYRSWFGTSNNDRTAGTTAQRPAAPLEEGFIYYDTDTSTYSRWTAGAYVAFTANNIA